MDQETIKSIINVIGALIALVTAYFATKKPVAKIVDAKIDSIQNADLRAAVKDSKENLDTILETFISNAENTVKPQIIKALEDGKVDRSELDGLTKTVTEEVMTQLPPAVKEMLGKIIVNLEAYVEARLIKVLHDMKDAPGTNVTHTVVNQKPVSYDDSIKNLNNFVENQLPKQIAEDKKNSLFTGGLNAEVNLGKVDDSFQPVDKTGNIIVDTNAAKNSDGTKDVIQVADCPS
jgi:hypothetical protein